MEKENLLKIVNKAQKGDSVAQQELYTDSVKSVYYLALKILGNIEDAEDITQDVFITVFEKLSELRQGETFYKWVNRITANKCMDFLRKTNRLSSEELTDEIMFEQSDDKTSVIPDKIADDMETRRMILEIIDNLPDAQRICVMYRYYSQLSVEEIAKIIGTNEHTVRSRLALARKKIKSAILEKEEKDDIQLHSIPIMPILVRNFDEFLMPKNVAESIWDSVSERLPTLVDGATALKAVAGAARIVTKKAIAAVVGVVIFAGGTTAAFIINLNNNQASVSDSLSASTESKSNVTSQSLIDETVSQTNPLTITSIGKNKLLVTLTDERIYGFLESDDMNTTQPAFNAYFFARNQQKLAISMSPFSWNVEGAEDMSSGMTLDFYINGQKDTYHQAENTLSFEVNQAGITDYLSQCDNYTLYYFDSNNNREILASGVFKNIVNQQASSESIAIEYLGSDQAVVRLAGDLFDSYLSGDTYHNLELGFYLPGNASYFPLYQLRLSAGTDYLSSKLYKLALRENEGILDSDELIGKRYNNAVKTDNGYSFQIFYEGIESLLSACDRIVIKDEQDKTLLTESYETAASNGKPKPIPSIPNLFEISPRDADYFYPVTDDYLVITLDIPTVCFWVYGYGYADGEKYYAPLTEHKAPLKIMTIISYNEFGITDKRTKIIYDSIASAMAASADRLDWYPASKLTGNSARDNDILADFMETLDQRTFGRSPNSSESYQYFGHYDNVRYFAATQDQIAKSRFGVTLPEYNQSSAYGIDGFLTETIPYEYEYTIFGDDGNLSQMQNGIATATVYYSKAVNN